MTVEKWVPYEVCGAVLDSPGGWSVCGAVRLVRNVPTRRGFLPSGPHLGSAYIQYTSPVSDVLRERTQGSTSRGWKWV